MQSDMTTMHNFIATEEERLMKTTTDNRGRKRRRRTRRRDRKCIDVSLLVVGHKYYFRFLWLLGFWCTTSTKKSSAVLLVNGFSPPKLSFLRPIPATSISTSRLRKRQSVVQAKNSILFYLQNSDSFTRRFSEPNVIKSTRLKLFPENQQESEDSHADADNTTTNQQERSDISRHSNTQKQSQLSETITNTSTNTNNTDNVAVWRNPNGEKRIKPTLSPILTGPPSLKEIKKVRLKVFSILNMPIVEVISAMSVLLSSFLVALDTLQDLPPAAYLAIDDALLILNLLFALDFFVRWYAAGQFKAIYLTKPLAVLDIVVVIIPLFASTALEPVLQMMFQSANIEDDGGFLHFLDGLQNAAGLQNLLLLRVLRLRRVLTDINTFGKFEVALGLKPQDVRPYQLQLARVLLSIFTLLSVASGLIYTAEHEVNSAIPDYFTSLYFGLTTLTTVGFGDISPVTSQGRFVVSASILAGVAIIPAQAAKLVDIFIESGKQMDQQTKLRPQLFASSNKSSSSSSSSSLSLSETEKRVSTKVMTVRKGSAADGKGPTGTSIDVTEASPLSEEDSTGGVGLEDSSRTCSQCGTSPHRIDAAFCWSCGSEL